MNIKYVLNYSKSVKLFEKTKIKQLGFINDSFLFYFRFFEQLNRFRIIQNVFYIHFFMPMKISFTSKMFYLFHFSVHLVGHHRKVDVPVSWTIFSLETSRIKCGILNRGFPPVIKWLTMSWVLRCCA